MCLLSIYVMFYGRSHLPRRLEIVQSLLCVLSLLTVLVSSDSEVIDTVLLGYMVLNSELSLWVLPDMTTHTFKSHNDTPSDKI